MEVWWPPIKVYFTPFTNMTLRVFEAFSGVGSQRMALRNLGIDHEVVATSDVDEFTVKSYTAIHSNDKTVSQATDEEMQDFLEKRNIPLNDKGVRKILKGNKLREFYEACIKSNNLGDISKVVTQDIPDHDLFTYSFPCQDISVAGKGLGLNEGSETRSGLLWECQKVIAVKKPKYLLLENVKNLVGKKHKHNFDKWLEWLEEQGYTNYWQVLNAKHYNIPQNRERVFVVSILGEHEPYEFPEPVELDLRLKDVLDEEVDEKFYLTEVQTERLIKNSDYLQGLNSEPKINVLAHRKNYRRNTQVFDPNGITETLDTGQGGGRGHYTIGVKMNRNEVKGEQDIARTLLARDYKGFGNQDMNGVVIGASRGRNPENPSDRTVGNPMEQRLEINKQGTSNTITTVQKDNYVVEAKEEFGRMGRQAVETLNENDVKHSDTINPFNKSVSSKDGICPTLTTRPEGFKTAVLPVVEVVKRLAGTTRPNDEIGVTLRANGDIRPHRMDKKKSGIQELNINYEDNSSHTVTSAHMPKVYGDTTNFRIRKLTPKECWRLMGFSDEDFHKAEEVNSNSQLYKQAGNSIVVDVLEAIFNQLLEEK